MNCERLYKQALSFNVVLEVFATHVGRQQVQV